RIVQTVDDATGEVISAVQLASKGNPDVKPERGSEIEAGFDAALLGNRMGVELTLYDKTTKDALMAVPLPESEVGIAGANQFQNPGEINNKGIELSVTGTPIRRRLVTWEARLGFSGN